MKGDTFGGTNLCVEVELSFLTQKKLKAQNKAYNCYAVRPNSDGYITVNTGQYHDHIIRPTVYSKQGLTDI